MLTNLFIWLGWSRDDLKWFWVQLVGAGVSVAGLIVDNVFDVAYWAHYVGLPVSEHGLHAIMAIAAGVVWIAGRFRRSPLPSGAAMASGVVAGSPAAKVGMVLLACVLAGAGVSGCGAKPYHVATVANSSLAQSIFALQDAEIAAHRAKLVTDDAHAKYKAQILKLLQAGDGLTVALQHWKAGEPMPANIGQAITDVSVMLADLRVLSPQAAGFIGQARVVLDLLQRVGVVSSRLEFVQASAARLVRLDRSLNLVHFHDGATEGQRIVELLRRDGDVERIAECASGRPAIAVVPYGHRWRGQGFADDNAWPWAKWHTPILLLPEEGHAARIAERSVVVTPAITRHRQRWCQALDRREGFAAGRTLHVRIPLPGDGDWRPAESVRVIANDALEIQLHVANVRGKIDAVDDELNRLVGHALILHLEAARV